MPRDPRHYAVAEAPAGTEGQRECARGTYCTGYRLVSQPDGTSRREPGLTYQAFCVPCTALIAEKLAELPQAYGRLETDLGDPVRRSEMIRVPFGPSVPLSEFYDGLMRQIAPQLCSWEARVRALKQLTPASGPVLSLDAVRGATATLGRNLSVLLALQPGWMTRTKPLPPGRRGQPPNLAVLEAEYGDCEIVRLGVDSVTLMVQLSGADAGMEILGMGRKCDLALGEAAARPELLDGIPCRSCGTIGLERADPPSDPDLPADYSRCPDPSCGDRMTLKTYRDWCARYKAWAEEAGPLKCQRCVNEDHAECVYSGCECAADGHPGQENPPWARTA